MAKNETVSFNETPIVKKLNDFIEHKDYLEASLSLRTLSDSLQIQPHHLSVVIKRYHNNSFNDFINSYRIAHATTLLASNKHNNLSIEGVGISSGFNSRATFYRAFKRIKGMTPKEYQKSLRD